MLERYLHTITLIGGRYFIVAGLCFLIFYILLKGVLANKKIQQRFPKGSDYLREIGYSTLTISIFGAVPVIFIYNENVAKYTTLYTDINKYGSIYFWAVFPIMLFMHDTYFYWMQTKIGKWINTSICHNQHHQYFKGNYGLYFLFWDRLMGTLREDYDSQYENVKSR